MSRDPLARCKCGALLEIVIDRGGVLAWAARIIQRCTVCDFVTWAAGVIDSPL